MQPSRRVLLRSTVILALLSGAIPAVNAAWPPAEPLAEATDGGNAALPESIRAASLGRDTWSCTFRFRAEAGTRQVAAVGSFNAWDRTATPLSGPDEDGTWSVKLQLTTGLYEYKFLVDGERWFPDPANRERVPDGFGGQNSILRLGRLAQLSRSDARRGDGQIDIVGLAHQPPQPLYVQAVGPDEVSLRYRTLSNDVERVTLAVQNVGEFPLEAVVVGPVFTFYEGRVQVPANGTARVRSLVYTFVLEDGDLRRCDPNIYRYSFTAASVFTAPDWARDAVWYQIMPDRFRNGSSTNDPQLLRPWTSEWFTLSDWEQRGGQTFYQNAAFERSYGGDLDGIEQQLPYLRALGVNTLYLTPVFVAPSYHKYDVGNYLHICPSFGVKEDLSAVLASEDLLAPDTWQWTASDRRFLDFVQVAHEQGFRIILDGVFNHVGITHPAFRDVQTNTQRSRFADWFDITSWEPFAYRGWAGFAHMPVFARNSTGFASDTLKEHLFAITRRWMAPDGDPSKGIDGWRLDVPNDVPRAFWSEWRRLVKSINPDALITGEVWTRADAWLDGEHFDAVMNYEFARTAVQWLFDRERKIPVSVAAARFAELRLAYPQAANHVVQNLIGSHDTDRMASMAQNPDREFDRQNRVQDNNPNYDNRKPSADSYARARLAALLQMTYLGAPLIYYGDEVGMWGADDPSSRKPMLWEDLGPYDQPEENAVDTAQLAFYRELIRLRHAQPALRRGEFRSLLTDDTADVWVFARHSDGAAPVIVALNASELERSVRVPLPEGLPATWTYLYGGQGGISATAGHVTIRVAPLNGTILVGGEP
ncbi:MAG: DUF3459 domain-containing protein [Phycisphaerales bacterium]|nr:DUF3459 domain-containing protein [Phycisphaerales bacterium]